VGGAKGGGVRFAPFSSTPFQQPFRERDSRGECRLKIIRLGGCMEAGQRFWVTSYGRTHYGEIESINQKVHVVFFGKVPEIDGKKRLRRAFKKDRFEESAAISGCQLKLQGKISDGAR
jgi:hypothetical protein